mmetsp:Transcript_30477/g.70881  ORF Transcript_30477/g.70881 Transcript_30477/m.70881 type:complete len:138 (-) Transcript_30477:135-548(-)
MAPISAAGSSVPRNSRAASPALRKPASKNEEESASKENAAGNSAAREPQAPAKAVQPRAKATVTVAKALLAALLAALLTVLLMPPSLLPEPAAKLLQQGPPHAATALTVACAMGLGALGRGLLGRTKTAGAAKEKQT